MDLDDQNDSFGVSKDDKKNRQKSPTLLDSKKVNNRGKKKDKKKNMKKESEEWISKDEPSNHYKKETKDLNNMLVSMGFEFGGKENANIVLEEKTQDVEYTRAHALAECIPLIFFSEQVFNTL